MERMDEKNWESHKNQSASFTLKQLRVFNHHLGFTHTFKALTLNHQDPNQLQETKRNKITAWLRP